MNKTIMTSIFFFNIIINLLKIISFNLVSTVTVISVSITPRNPSGVAGVDDVTLTCTGTLSGPAIAKIQWTGQRIHTPPLATAPTTTVSNSSVLTRVRQSNAGTYTCTVTIGASSMSRSVVLTVTGEFVILKCEILFHAAIHI